MKIVDHAGNSIVKGRLMRWQPSPQGGHGDYYVKVIDVVHPTQHDPGKVIVTVMFGVAPLGKTKLDEAVVRFGDFVTVFDPEDELKAELAVKRATEAIEAEQEVERGVQPIRQD